MSQYTEEELRKAIEEFYLPKHLVKSIYDLGQIPAHSTQTNVGIGFIDIADYTYLSKFLSPNENQIVINGLYTAFQIVLERHGGYLNKIEGDSMMFHFDGIINSQFRSYSPQEQEGIMAKELFYTCVEMQRVCSLFNQASNAFIDNSASESTKAALQSAFDIIQNLRSQSDTSNALHAFFQIRIRIGANLGEVTIGNFGPEGAKQWDVIGLPVINAKRMESTAPIGGLRISSDFYKILEKNGVVEQYVQRFRREAIAMSSVYQQIKKDELFAFKTVVLAEKKNASFDTYSVQVVPNMPEVVIKQMDLLLDHDEMGALRIIEMLQYYRGNKYVIDLVEKLFKAKQIVVRKGDILSFLQPQAFHEIEQNTPNHEALETLVGDKFSLFDLFMLMDDFGDSVKRDPIADSPEPWYDYEKTMKNQMDLIKSEYEKKKFVLIQRRYFFDVVYPLVFLSIKNSIMEYQHKVTEVAEELLEELPEIEAI